MWISRVLSALVLLHALQHGNQFTVKARLLRDGVMQLITTGKKMQ